MSVVLLVGGLPRIERANARCERDPLPFAPGLTPDPPPGMVERAALQRQPRPGEKFAPLELWPFSRPAEPTKAPATGGPKCVIGSVLSL